MKPIWNISEAVIDSFDRTKLSFTPYTGPIPPNGVYRFRVTRLMYVPGAAKKYPCLRISLELVPREDSEDKYAGYFIMAFRPIAENNAFTYVPFLDALNVSSADFIRRCVADDEGVIQKIGTWRNVGNTEVFAQVVERDDQNGNPRKDIGWFGTTEKAGFPGRDGEEDEENEDDFEEEENEDDYEVDSEEEEEEEEEEEPEPEPVKPVRGRKPSAKPVPAKRAPMAARVSKGKYPTEF